MGYTVPASLAKGSSSAVWQCLLGCSLAVGLSKQLLCYLITLDSPTESCSVLDFWTEGSLSHCCVAFLSSQSSACYSIRLLLSYTGAFRVLLATSRPLAAIFHSAVTPQVFWASFFIITTRNGEKQMSATTRTLSNMLLSSSFVLFLPWEMASTQEKAE